MLVFCGMTASGKSTLGRAWASRNHAPYYNTDRIRKELAGLQAEEKRPDAVGRGIYSPSFSARTYQVMLDQARRDFALGERLVVLDGSYGKRADRDRVRAMATVAGARSVFLFCMCSEKETQRRLAVRAQDLEAVSDGRWEIYLHQRQTFEPPDEKVGEDDCMWLNTEQSVATLLQWLTVRFCGLVAASSS